MEKKKTIRDVAKYLGVSVATVSNVLNGKNKTSEETKLRILQAIQELDYQPDFTARSLAKRKSNLIGVMFPFIEENIDTSFLSRDNLFYGEFIGGIEYRAKKSGYDFLISGTKSGKDCRAWIRKRNLEGVIVVGVCPKDLYSELKGVNIPVVLIDTYEEYTGGFHSIAIDDKAGAMMAVNYLVELGHRNIALASGSIRSSKVNVKRYEGYRKVLEDSGIYPDETLVFEEEVSFAGGYRIGERILDSGNDVTAIFAVADIIAFGIIKAFKSRGKLIPKDMSIVGFDNLKMCEFLTPGLTTVSQNVFQKGAIAAETLIRDIESGKRSEDRIILPIELVVRESAIKI